MGKEVVTKVRIGRKSAECRVLLETKEIVVRGGFPRRIPLAALQALEAREPWLTFEHDGEAIAIELGSAAATWLAAIRNPRTRMQKLGITKGAKVCVLGTAEVDALEELEVALGTAPTRRLAKTQDQVLRFSEDPAELADLGRLEAALASGGAVWWLWPKGRKDYAHEHVVAAARAHGLVQTRSLGFSERFTGLRLVRPAK